MLSKFCLASLPVILIAALTASSAFAKQTRFHETSDSGMSYELIIESEAPEVMQPLPVKINVARPDGTPATGAIITCSLTMPAMAMPNNKPPIKASGTAGQYQGVFLLTMGGLWNVELTAAFSSGEQDAVVIPIPGVISDETKNSVDSKLEGLFHEGSAVEN